MILSDQCKQIEETNRMAKTRDLLNKIRDTKVTFHAKMGIINDRNGMELTEAEDMKKRWNANQNHNEVPFHASQNGCNPKVYKQIGRAHV